MANVRVYFATNRDLLPGKRAGVFGKTFNPDGVAALRFGHADFAGAAAPKVEVYPEKIEAGEAVVLGSERFLKSLHGVMANGATDTLIFIHGFNVSFMGALAAGADLRGGAPPECRGVQLALGRLGCPADGLLQRS